MSIIFIIMSAAVVVTPPAAELTLAQLPVGARARIIDVTEPGPLGERLLELGLTPGTQILLVRAGLGGDPLQLWVRGGMLSVRRAQASRIRVTALR